MLDRRGFAKAAGATAAAAALAGLTPDTAFATDRVGAPATSIRGVHRGLGPIEHIAADELNVGYADLGPRTGHPILLLHGWPYDIHGFELVAPLLAREGYRVIVPYFRGHGSTTFIADSTPRNAQQSRVALDIIALMDALAIKQAMIAGYDWGSRTGDIIAALWPERVRALVSVTGYLITKRATSVTPLPPKSEWAWWYQYYFATERGEAGLTNPEYRVELARLVWSFNSPTWRFDEATFQRTATAFTNSDYVPVVISNYRWRLGFVPGEPQYDALEAKLAAGPSISVPTITLDGEKDPFTPAGNGSTYRSHFTGPYEHRTLRNIGHNVPQEAPVQFVQAVIDSLRL